jgi:hypothetical protein
MFLLPPGSLYKLATALLSDTWYTQYVYKDLLQCWVWTLACKVACTVTHIFSISECGHDDWQFLSWITNIFCNSSHPSMQMRPLHRVYLLEDGQWLQIGSEIPCLYCCVPRTWVHGFTTWCQIPDPTFVGICWHLVWYLCATIHHIREIPQHNAAVSWTRHAEQARLQRKEIIFKNLIICIWVGERKNLDHNISKSGNQWEWVRDVALLIRTTFFTLFIKSHLHKRSFGTLYNTRNL